MSLLPGDTGETLPGVTRDIEQTITGRKTFTGPGDNNSGSTGHWLGSVVTDDITVQPNSSISPSASMFLDNAAGQVWEFFCNGDGEWGIYDKTGSSQPLALEPSSGSYKLTVTTPGQVAVYDNGGAGFTNGSGILVQSTSTTDDVNCGFTVAAHNGANTWQFSARATNQGDGTLFGFYQFNGTGWATVLTITRSCQITVEDGGNFIFGTTTGTKIGTAGGSSGQKIGFYGASPVTQPLLATGASHTVDDVITVLQTLGLVRQS